MRFFHSSNFSKLRVAAARETAGEEAESAWGTFALALVDGLAALTPAERGLNQDTLQNGLRLGGGLLTPNCFFGAHSFLE
jgi:hypothetical protein